MQRNPFIIIDGKAITEREFSILQKVAQGFLRKQIAAALGDKSLNTLNAQMRLLFQKIGVQKVNDLIIWCLENGFDREGNYTPKVLEVPVVTPTLPAKPKSKKKKAARKK